MTTCASAGSIASVNAVLFYSSEGIFQWGLYTEGMAKLWTSRLQDKLIHDLNWPINATVELIDIKSNVTFMEAWTTQRVARTDLSPVSIFLFGEVGYDQMPWFEQFKIPCFPLAMSANTGRDQIGMGPGYNYTFVLKPAVRYNMRSISQKYVEVGVKSVVAIANIADYALSGNTYSYSTDNCINGAKGLMVPKGIELLDSISYNGFAMTREDAMNIVKRLQVLQPDAVLICDIMIFFAPQLFDTWLVKIMKEMDYLPKTLFVGDADGSLLAQTFAPQGYLDYTVQASYAHPKLTGVDYTEEDGPYSSQFRTSTPITTVNEELLSGSNLPNYPSSSKLFYNWFLSQTGYTPKYLSYGIWGGFDIVEQAFWRGGKSEVISADGLVDAKEMYDLLIDAQAPTPYGRIAFDAHRINTKSDAVVLQYLDSTVDTEIVAPSYLATHEFVYPMPTWKERYYEWSLMKGQTSSAIAVAAACSALLIVMMITLTIFREERDIKMLYYPHLMILMMMVLTILWALVFAWQGDVNQAQCDSLLWTIYLPASFVIQLVNMKAYRLSVFLTSDSKTRLKKFTHHYVMKLTLGWVSFTAILLLAAQLADPPTKRTVVVDKYRPSQDYNVCSHGDTTNGILFFLFAQHLFMAMVCVAVVRNGMEGFKDGMIMKESFTILFACIAVAFVMDLLGLDHQTNYFLRAAFVGIGFTLFAARLLMSRCARHWVTQSMAMVIIKYYKIYQSLMPQSGASEGKISAIEMYSMTTNPNDVENQKHRSSVSSHDDESGIGVVLPDKQNIDEMMRALSDEKRGPFFRQIAEKGLLAENVDFLMALNELPKKYSNVLSLTSTTSTQAMKVIADELYTKFIMTGSDLEVNVSHGVRQKIVKKLETWPMDQPFIDEKKAAELVEDDVLNVVNVFKNAEKEISLMLYQNIWDKFRTAEMETNMS